MKHRLCRLRFIRTAAKDLTHLCRDVLSTAVVSGATAFTTIWLLNLLTHHR